MEGKVFDYPKTVEMLMKTIEMGTDSDEGAYVLDFSPVLEQPLMLLCS